MLHTQPASWIEIVVTQDDLPSALEALANLNAVELESETRERYAPADLSGLRSGIEEYAELARRYRTYWPNADYATPMPSIAPADILSDALDRAHRWAIKAQPHIALLQNTVRHETDFTHLATLLDAIGDDFPISFLSGENGELFDAALYLLHDDRYPASLPPDVVVTTYETERGAYLAAVGEKEDMARLAAELVQIKAREIFVPHINVEHTKDIPSLLEQRVASLRAERTRAQTKLVDLSTTFDIAQIRANIERLRWLADHIGYTANTALFTRITGWSAQGPAVLKQALDFAGVDYALSVNSPPPGLSPPRLFDNARWVRPFETFVRLMGMPAQSEADPSLLVALIVPLLFGFMFGDVGQGLVLLLAGLWLKRRWPTTAILVPGGGFAMAFGFVFGSVFAREDVITPLWLSPLSNPIPVLTTALAIGVAILLMGLILNNRQAHWQGQDRIWWSRDGGIVAAYVGLLASFADIRGLALSGIGVIWFLAGSAAQGTNATERLSALGLGVGSLLESLFQLLINTLSFVRIGAFAIAHAGLSSAVVILADITGGTADFWFVMIVGNVFILALEGLVVGVQTTRLVLFEFFIRFLRAGGRPLRALPTPANWAMNVEGGTI